MHGRAALLWLAGWGCGIVSLAAQSAVELGDPKLVAQARDLARENEGEALFARTCAVPYCHGKEGGPGRAPALRERIWNLKELRDTIRDGVPNSSMPNWDDKLSPRQIESLVAYVLSISGQGRSGQTASAAPSSPAPASIPGRSLPESLVGSPARGEELFFQSGERGCAGCHAIDGKGGAAGPDLSGSARREARALFDDIVDPGARVARDYALLRITTKDGEKIAALRSEESDAALRVYDVGTVPPVLRRLRKDAIASIEADARSAMPARYGESFTLRQLLDLVSFLKSSGAASPVRVTYQEVR